MKKTFLRIRKKLLKLLIATPYMNRYKDGFYRGLGVQGKGYRISNNVDVVGEFSNLFLGEQVEINSGCFLLAKESIRIGKNSTLAYQTTILTSANPNGPHNKLSKLYPKMKAAVNIGHDTWIGARATILPGVTIGNFCIVAAGAVVNKDVPNYTVVAGVPAKPVKQLTPSDFE